MYGRSILHPVYNEEILIYFFLLSIILFIIWFIKHFLIFDSAFSSRNRPSIESTLCFKLRYPYKCIKFNKNRFSHFGMKLALTLRNPEVTIFAQEWRKTDNYTN